MACQAALAQVKPGPPAVAERFELYYCGVELANGYYELTDPAEFRRRLLVAAQQRKNAGKPPLPVKNRLLDAMRWGFPPTTGVAMGFDRVAMLAIGETKIEKVMSFHHDCA